MWNSNVFEIEEKDTDFVINTNTGKTHIGSGSWTETLKMILLLFTKYKVVIFCIK